MQMLIRNIVRRNLAKGINDLLMLMLFGGFILDLHNTKHQTSMNDIQRGVYNYDWYIGETWYLVITYLISITCGE